MFIFSNISKADWSFKISQSNILQELSSSPHSTCSLIVFLGEVNFFPPPELAIPNIRKTDPFVGLAMISADADGTDTYVNLPYLMIIINIITSHI